MRKQGATHVSRNPQAAWLEATPESVSVAGASHVDRSELYPRDAIRGFHLAPGDGWLETQKRAMEEPGVLAGFSHTDDLPKLSGGRSVDNYAWAPLARRMDIDHLFRACR